jgi:hypothetical protein
MPFSTGAFNAADIAGPSTGCEAEAPRQAINALN